MQSVAWNRLTHVWFLGGMIILPAWGGISLAQEVGVRSARRAPANGMMV